MAVQPHLSKCFDAIKSLEFGTQKDKQTGLTVPSNDILAMVSPENGADCKKKFIHIRPTTIIYSMKLKTNSFSIRFEIFY